MENQTSNARGRERPSKEYKNKLATRKMLLQAGTEVVTKKGFSAVGGLGIVQQTGISTCSFYYSSKTKRILALNV